MDGKSAKFIRNILHLYNVLYEVEKEIGREDIKERYVNKFEKIFSRLNKENSKVWRFLIWRIPLEPILSHKELNSLGKKIKNRFLKAFRISLEKNFVEVIRFSGSGKEYPSYKMAQPSFQWTEDILFRGFKFIRGRRKVLLIASHSTPPLSDKYTGEIAEMVANRSNSYALISNVSRVLIDYNRFTTRITPFRRIIDRLIFEEGIRLILDLHGFKRGTFDVEIGLRGGLTSNFKIVSKLRSFLEEEGLSVVLNSQKFFGGDVISYHSYPPHISCLQIEINSSVRRKDVLAIINGLTKFILEVK